MSRDSGTTTTLAKPSADTAADAAHDGPDQPARGSFASSSVPRHLARGAIGFGALIASLALLPWAGWPSLLLAPVGVVALRGCPMCWAVGLAETISAGRLRRACKDGVCTLTRTKG
ncbi:hypothetical protein [Yinghuangia soli]|uniref:Uncharacterized protein n=1 Tax=Yinghuangia soli TaxID=2908204 RepID=A0AA41U1J5_9ACTN|nr:hypothetical protein [Yinghuangia soli]MCF2526199.1 hypothetical protein [Yinghuangia soli]